ncbi:hypothetical protein GCM10010377_41640 [Streptomyces viridiviolaceus]|uniref:SpoIIE family protein phosphatase n=1 Tax=Streptomyces viridiviolaceus TaxID=68282 RepID=A0ABW2E575_9ACTN|nr:SpoIIE family protein phosphatase [Streptomyces viridiviolaceus]GHB46433.1 hypothetical protein GCM10010377_41640 [Streptomyces viridiviolaceus]
MTAGAEDADRPPGLPAALLIDASTEAISATGGHAGGIYLRSRSPGVLWLAVLAGLPGPLFRPWWRMHADRPFPVADAYRLGVRVLLPNATETMRRYPQFAAGLPFPFGSLHVPITGAAHPFGVLTVLRPAVPDVAEMLDGLDVVERLAGELGASLERWEDGGGSPVHPDGRTQVLDVPGGVVLGVDPQAQYPLTEFRLDPDAVLALYTDGLVERPGTDIDDGITALRVALAECGAPVPGPGGRSLASIADRLTVMARHAVDRPDDISLLLAVRRPGHGSPR